MQQKLTVAGALRSIPSVRGVEVESDADGVTFTASSEADMQRLKRLLALQLADVITGEYEEKSLSAYIDAAHPYFLPGERQHILHAASLAMQKHPPASRTQYIENRLYAFLSESEVLSLEGFLNFRLKEYKALLKNAADTAVNVYLAEREYEEFITLLRYFVNTQTPAEPVLHVVAETDGRFTLLNYRGEDVGLLCGVSGAPVAELTEEDILLSTLITVAPEEITFHKVKEIRNIRLLETVMKVFSGRVHVCESCPLCDGSQKNGRKN